jgi:hypothetical protein
VILSPECYQKGNPPWQNRLATFAAVPLKTGGILAGVTKIACAAQFPASELGKAVPCRMQIAQ